MESDTEVKEKQSLNENEIKLTEKNYRDLRAAIDKKINAIKEKHNGSTIGFLIEEPRVLTSKLCLREYFFVICCTLCKKRSIFLFSRTF